MKLRINKSIKTKKNESMKGAWVAQLRINKSDKKLIKM